MKSLERCQVLVTRDEPGQSLHWSNLHWITLQHCVTLAQRHLLTSVHAAKHSRHMACEWRMRLSPLSNRLHENFKEMHGRKVWKGMCLRQRRATLQGISHSEHSILSSQLHSFQTSDLLVDHWQEQCRTPRWSFWIKMFMATRPQPFLQALQVSSFSGPKRQRKRPGALLAANQMLRRTQECDHF